MSTIRLLEDDAARRELARSVGVRVVGRIFPRTEAGEFAAGMAAVEADAPVDIIAKGGRLYCIAFPESSFILPEESRAFDPRD